MKLLVFLFHLSIEKSGSLFLASKNILFKYFSLCNHFILWDFFGVEDMQYHPNESDFIKCNICERVV